MRINKFFDNHEGWLLASIFLFFSILYISQLTTSGLWYDEAIEYFYSKYMTGPVPVNPIDQTGSNMYERICITYQPPLYNFIMYLWLQLFDSESGYRLAGVITTIVGAIGFYFAIRRIAGYKWGAICISIYLSTSVVTSYALECGEYNLMLCMECWMLYFFVVCVQSHCEKVGWYPLLGFFLFATLSIYSQYGAVFFILGLSIALYYTYYKYKNITSIFRLSFVGGATCVFAIIPLYVFFIRIQMANQGSLNVTHYPVFVGNILWGIPYSFFKAFHEQIKWIFSSSLVFCWFSVKIMQILIYILVLLTIISLFIKTKLSLLLPTIVANISCYTIFFILSACSYYAYNWWDGHLGCYNIIYYKRYVLFYIPLLLFTIALGMISIYNHIRNTRYCEIARGCIAIVIITFIINFSYCLQNVKKKSDAREATFEWFERNDFDHKIVVQGAFSPMFMYYVQHSTSYFISTKNIILTKQELHEPKQVEDHLREIGIFSLTDFYFIGNNYAWNMKGKGMKFIHDLFTNEGYDVKVIRSLEKESALLFIKRNNQERME